MVGVTAGLSVHAVVAALGLGLTVHFNDGGRRNVPVVVFNSDRDSQARDPDARYQRNGYNFHGVVRSAL